MPRFPRTADEVAQRQIVTIASGKSDPDSVDTRLTTPRSQAVELRRPITGPVGILGEMPLPDLPVTFFIVMNQGMKTKRDHSLGLGSRRKGTAIVYMAVSMTVMVGFSSLGVDVARCQFAKSCCRAGGTGGGAGGGGESRQRPDRGDKRRRRDGRQQYLRRDCRLR